MSDLKTSQFSVRCDPALAERVRNHAAAKGVEPPVFIRDCLLAICEMIDDPNNNDLPEIVAVTRYAQAYKKKPTQMNAPRKTA